MSVRRVTGSPVVPAPQRSPARPAGTPSPAANALPPSGLDAPRPKQRVTLDVPAQPTSRDDVYLRGAGPGWVDPEAAAPHHAAQVTTFSGPLFKDEPSATDVQQGQLGDCYFCAAMAALAHTNPQWIKDFITPKDDGSAEVRFFEREVITGELKPVTVRVDAELYTQGGRPVYGRSPGDAQSMELWFALAEKAWATWRGGYEPVGRGGVQNQIFEAVLGRPAGWLAIDDASSPEAAWGTIVATLQAGLPLGAATHSVDDGRYANTGVFANHGYTVLDAEVTPTGERLVVLRNPWGSGEPRGDGVDDGIFRLPLTDFTRLFGQLQFTLVS